MIEQLPNWIDFTKLLDASRWQVSDVLQPMWSVTTHRWIVEFLGGFLTSVEVDEQYTDFWDISENNKGQFSVLWY